ncbi:hypothetical protein HN011_006597 [Eciton burchellii]|nr:hypothetical protein HN011_006597 [Eciton burchellii]
MLAPNAFFYALCCIIPFLNVNVAEWVEMPQFSNEHKIYRIPSVQYEQLFKFKRSDVNNIHSPDDQRNDNQSYHLTTIYDRPDEKEIKKINSVPLTSSNSFRDQIADSFVDISNNHTVINTVESIIKDKLDNKSLTKNRNDMLKAQSLPITTRERETLRDMYYNHTLKQNNTMFQYLPMDILKNVHCTLQSQPISFEEKLHFLKIFEKTLMTEIESRLARAITPSRKIRGADYYGHDHDDQDDHSVGFPSIEGALMAISFLTFAVYLVRLVMLLFRNMNNPMPTTTAATVFFGKRKRSVDFNDDTARILNNINNFDSAF